VLRPADVANSPPRPLFPLPMLTSNAPARPAVAALDPMATNPPFPAAVRPELNASRPLVPALPVFPDIIITRLLLVAVPSPPMMGTRPPLDILLRPALNDT
jgi:hypothetical protein